MTERLVRFTEDIILEDGCSRHWNLENVDPHWYYQCTKHGFQFGLDQPCPGSLLAAKAGEQMYLPQKVAARFVSSGQAVYPTHEPEVSDGLTETLDRANALMDDMGLPHLDHESMRAIGIQGKRGSGHYARPKDGRLAGSLGVDPADIAEMRRLAKGEQ